MEHPILFLDLLFGKFGLHIPPHLTYAVLVSLILLGLGWLAGRQVTLVTKGAHNVFELIVGGLEEFMVDITGEEGRAFFPYIGTVFLFIMFCNLIGLLPGFLSPTANINTTLSLALCTFVRRRSWLGASARSQWCITVWDMAKNSVLIEQLAPTLADARARRCLSGAASVRVFAELEYRTQRSWSRSRRVVGRAEVMAAGDNPRFVVTNLPADGFKGEEDRERFEPQRLYEELYCARGEMENQLKQQVLDLRPDRLSTHHLASNQLRLWLATFAYLLLERVRTLGLAGTELGWATVGSVRLKLLKVAAQVRVSVRRVYVQLSSAYPLQELFRLCHRRLMRWAPASG